MYHLPRERAYLDLIPWKLEPLNCQYHQSFWFMASPRNYKNKTEVIAAIPGLTLWLSSPKLYWVNLVKRDVILHFPGAALGPFLTGILVYYGWQAVFMMLILADLTAFVITVVIAFKSRTGGTHGLGVSNLRSSFSLWNSLLYCTHTPQTRGRQSHYHPSSTNLYFYGVLSKCFLKYKLLRYLDTHSPKSLPEMTQVTGSRVVERSD